MVVPAFTVTVPSDTEVKVVVVAASWSAGRVELQAGELGGGQHLPFATGVPSASVTLPTMGRPVTVIVRYCRRYRWAH